jgi:hypothetical protein
MTTHKPDQLDMQCEMATRFIRRKFEIAKGLASLWEPRHFIYVPGDADRIYLDEVPLKRKAIRP